MIIINSVYLTYWSISFFPIVFNSTLPYIKRYCIKLKEKTTEEEVINKL
jgi:hypothetical protein